MNKKNDTNKPIDQKAFQKNEFQKNEFQKNEFQKIDTPVFSTLVHSITHSALATMGLIPEIKDKKNKAMAEFNIELLIMLKEKTKENLNKEEQNLIDNCIQDLQITFSQQMSKK